MICCVSYLLFNVVKNQVKASSLSFFAAIFVLFTILLSHGQAKRQLLPFRSLCCLSLDLVQLLCRQFAKSFGGYGSRLFLKFLKIHCGGKREKKEREEWVACVTKQYCGRDETVCNLPSW